MTSRSRKKAIYRSLLTEGAFTREHAFGVEMLLKGFGYKCKTRAPRFIEHGMRVDSFANAVRGYRIYDIEHEWLAHLINFLSGWGGSYTIVERLHLTLVAIDEAFDRDATRDEAIDSLLRMGGWGGFYIALNSVMKDRLVDLKSWEALMLELTERLMEHAVVGSVMTPHEAFRRANYRGW